MSKSKLITLGQSLTVGWSAFFAEMCEIVENEQVQRSISAAAANHAVFTLATGLPRRRQRNLRYAATSGIDCFCLTLVRTGQVTVETATQPSRTFTSGDVYFVDLSSEHALVAVGPVRLEEACIYIPRRRIADLVAPEVAAGWSATARDVTQAALVAFVEFLANEAGRLTPPVLEATVDAVVAVAVDDMRVTAGSLPGEPGSAGPLINKIRQFIDRHIMSDALTPDLIAGDFALSRAVLYRLFQPMGGVTTYIRRQRMARALHDLSGHAASHRRIGSVAHRYGYKNAAAFTRVFRETYGITPREVGRRPPLVAGGDRLIDLLAPLCGLAPLKPTLA